MKPTKHTENTPLFEEVQRFSQWVVWAILIIVFAVSFIGMIIEILQKDSISISDIFPICFFVLIFFSIFALLFFTKLHTEICKTGITTKFLPLQKRKTYLWSEIRNIYVRKYSPIKEFGGFGLRGTKKNRALNTYGNWGLQLEFKDGKKLLIGTQQPDQIELVLKKMKKEELI